MATKILAKRSAVANKVPLTTDLSLGELALNTYDGALYFKKSPGGVDSIITVATTTGTQTLTNKTLTTPAITGYTTLIGNTPFLEMQDSSNGYYPVSLYNQTGAFVIYQNSSKSMSLTGNGAVSFGSTTNYGKSGQVLTSQGSSAAPIWKDTYPDMDMGTFTDPNDLTVIATTAIDYTVDLGTF